MSPPSRPIPLPTTHQTLHRRQQQESHERYTGHGVAYNRLISEEEEQGLRRAAMKERLRRGTREEMERWERENRDIRISVSRESGIRRL